MSAATAALEAAILISDVAIRRPVITVVTMLALVGFGIYALANLETDEFPDIQAPIFGALALAVMLMYLILVAQFNSFVDPLAILVSLPLSLIGVVLALLVTGDSLNIMSLIGVVLLMGVVAKNAILLLDFAKWQRDEGVDRRTAIIEAGRIRLRPIVMTSVALIAGMTPVALGLGEGADFRAPLGRAVIGGVVASTILTLLIIPTVYEILDDAVQGVKSLLRKGIRTRLLARSPTRVQ